MLNIHLFKAFSKSLSIAFQVVKKQRLCACSQNHTWHHHGSSLQGSALKTKNAQLTVTATYLTWFM